MSNNQLDVERSVTFGLSDKKPDMLFDPYCNGERLKKLSSGVTLIGAAAYSSFISSRTASTATRIARSGSWHSGLESPCRARS